MPAETSHPEKGQIVPDLAEHFFPHCVAHLPSQQMPALLLQPEKGQIVPDLAEHLSPARPGCLGSPAAGHDFAHFP